MHVINKYGLRVFDLCCEQSKKEEYVYHFAFACPAKLVCFSSSFNDGSKKSSTESCRILQGLPIDEFAQGKLDITAKELCDEREDAVSVCQD